MLSAFPRATNVSPGQGGYLLIALVLTGVTIWVVYDRGVSAPFSRWEWWAVWALFTWVTAEVFRASPYWRTALAATLLAALALVCPWSLSAASTAARRVPAVIVTLSAAVVGSAIAAWFLPLLAGRGIAWRPGLPLGSASGNAVGLLLALAGVLTGALLWTAHRWVWRVLTVVSVLLIVQTGSRAAWALAIILVLAAALLHRRKAVGRVLVASGALSVAAIVVLLLTRGRRFFLARPRWENTEVALGAWAESPSTVVVGLGPMQMWPWLSLEWNGQAATVMREGPWGRVLYHAHSTYLHLLVEYGIVGLALFLLVLAFVVRRCVVEIRRGGELSLVAVALLLSLPAMLVELYLFRGFVTAFLWWAAVLAVGRVDRGGGFEAPTRNVGPRP